MDLPDDPEGRDDRGDEPGLPEELQAFLEQMGGAGVLRQMQFAMAGGGGPVNWDLARQVATQLATEGDRPPHPDEVTRAEEAQRIAEHWLDEGGLPAPPDAGRLRATGRQAWTNAALDGLRPLVEPVAAASVRALGDLLTDQLQQPGQLPEGLELGGFDLSEGLAGLGRMLEPMGGVLMGLQAGQVIGQLSRQMLGQYDLGVPTADPAVAYAVAVNIAEVFDGYELDPTEVAVVLALHEGAHRRQYHAVPWLGQHIQALVAQFAEGTRLDPEQLMDVSREVMEGVDPDDPESLQAAMERAAGFRLTPTPDQQRVLERIQGVIALLQAWARREVREAAQERLPNLDRIGEVLRRRRASKGDGEKLLAALLGLDLTPADDTLGEAFIQRVQEARGLEGLRRALAHPENLPDAEELAEPSRWLVRMASGEDVPDDPSALFGDEEAPVEPSAEERTRRPDEGRDDDSDA